MLGKGSSDPPEAPTGGRKGREGRERREGREGGRVIDMCVLVGRAQRREKKNRFVR